MKLTKKSFTKSEPPWTNKESKSEIWRHRMRVMSYTSCRRLWIIHVNASTGFRLLIAIRRLFLRGLLIWCLNNNNVCIHYWRNISITIFLDQVEHWFGIMIFKNWCWWTRDYFSSHVSFILFVSQFLAIIFC